MGFKLIDMTGNVYGRLTVLREGGRNEHGKVLWICKCECGAEKSIPGGNLRAGQTISCGCYNRERQRKWPVEPAVVVQREPVDVKSLLGRKLQGTYE